MGIERAHGALELMLDTSDLRKIAKAGGDVRAGADDLDIAQQREEQGELVTFGRARQEVVPGSPDVGERAKEAHNLGNLEDFAGVVFEALKLKDHGPSLACRLHGIIGQMEEAIACVPHLS